MKSGGHSRHTTRFDKLPTVIVEHPNIEGRVLERAGYPAGNLRGTSKQRQTVKKLQKRKQRQFDKKLAREREEPEWVCGRCRAPRDFAFDFCRVCGSGLICRPDQTI